MIPVFLATSSSCLARCMMVRIREGEQREAESSLPWRMEAKKEEEMRTV